MSSEKETVRTTGASQTETRVSEKEKQDRSDCCSIESFGLEQNDEPGAFVERVMGRHKPRVL